MQNDSFATFHIDSGYCDGGTRVLKDRCPESSGDSGASFPPPSLHELRPFYRCVMGQAWEALQQNSPVHPYKPLTFFFISSQTRPPPWASRCTWPHPTHSGWSQDDQLTNQGSAPLLVRGWEVPAGQGTVSPSNPCWSRDQYSASRKGRHGAST